MNMIGLIGKKLKVFRMPVPSLILLALASYRALTSGYSIQLVGICASAVPFFGQIKTTSHITEGVSVFQEVLSSVLSNLVLMIIYLVYFTLLTIVGQAVIPSYAANPHYMDMLLIAVCANVVFIFTLIPIYHDLKPLQRLMLGILLCNAQLIFMVLACDYIEKVSPEKLSFYAYGFIVLMLVLALGFMKLCYSEKK